MNRIINMIDKKEKLKNKVEMIIQTAPPMCNYGNLQFHDTTVQQLPDISTK